MEKHIELMLGPKGTTLYQKLFSLKRRFPQIFPAALLGRVGRFLFNCSESFLQQRPIHFIGRLLFIYDRFIRGGSSGSKVAVSILKVDAATYGVAIAIRDLHEQEIFHEVHIIKSVQNLIPGIKSLPGSYFSYQNGKQHLFYLEIKKVRGGSFTSDEREKLGLRLPFELQQKIEPISPSLVFPGNEEELFKNIRRLSQELSSSDDLSQVMISFLEYSQKTLKFLVIVLRIVQNDTPSIVVLSKQLPSLVYFSLEDVLNIGQQHKQFAKEAAIFTLEVDSSIFLRHQREIDMRAGRQYIAKALESMLGAFRDFNGGFFAKENEQLLAIRRELEGCKLLPFAQLDDLFYSIKPITMRALITPQTGVEIARLFKKSVERELDEGADYIVEAHCADETQVVMIKTREKEWKILLPRLVLSHYSQRTFAYLEQEGVFYLCFFQQSLDDSSLLSVVQEQLQKLKLAEQETHQERNLSVLRLNFQRDDPPSLNPRLATDMQCQVLCDLLFEGLTRMTHEGKVQLAAAERVEISADEKSYTFHLRPSFWSNGEEVTAYQFERSWKKALLSNTGLTRLEVFFLIKNAREARRKMIGLDHIGVVAKDAKTLHVELENRCPYFMNLLAAPLFFPLLDDAEEPVHFNGPFILAEWKRDEKLYLSQNLFYWNAQCVKLAGVNISMIRDPQVAYKMFYEGKLDLIGDPLSPLPLDKIKIVDRAQELVCKDVSRLFLLHCNTQVYPLNNANLRRALNAALDRRQLVERVFIKQRPHASPLPTKYSFLEEEEQFDPDKAMHYFETALKELNLDCQTFPPLTLTYSELSYERPLFAELESQWRQRLGITLLSKELPWSEFFEALSSGNFELGGLFRRNVFNHPMSYLSFYNHSPLWENKEFQQLLKNLDQDKTLKKIEQFLMREMPVIPLVNQRYLILKHPRIKGVEWLDNGSLDLTRAWIDENY